MDQTDARGETGATMEGMVEEKGIVPERSEWFRSSGIIGTAQGHKAESVRCSQIRTTCEVAAGDSNAVTTPYWRIERFCQNLYNPTFR